LAAAFSAIEKGTSMKVVLFCGGLGLRMGEESVRTPKPMVPVGSRPILWHIMKYFAHFGHKDFIICLGHQPEVIKEYFLKYNEALSNDFILSGNSREVEVLRSDMDDWRITFVDTGAQSNIGERLSRVRSYLEGEEVFLAHYGDTLTDAPLPTLIRELEDSDAVANFLCVRPLTYSFHTVELEATGGRVTSIKDIPASDIWINGGFFVLRRQIFDYMRPGEELVHEPFQRLIGDNALIAHRYEGFWAPMDTLKDRQNLQILTERGTPPWAVWAGAGAGDPVDSLVGTLSDDTPSAEGG
jgi:glucose-1-phosphate cytidylyltransferase